MNHAGATYDRGIQKKQNGKEYVSYVCGNKYRTRTCKAKQINALPLEIFVVQILTNYLKTANFDEVGRTVAKKVNGASADLSAEKKRARIR